MSFLRMFSPVSRRIRPGVWGGQVRCYDVYNKPIGAGCPRVDVLVMGTEKLLPGCIADVRPLGHLSMIDEKGEDEKVLAVPARDPRFKDVQTLDDVCEHHRREITHFFEKYKDLEGGKWVKIGNWSGTEAVYDLINSTHRSYMHSMARSPLDG